MASHLSMLGRLGPPPRAAETVRQHLDALARARGSAPWAARFRSDTVASVGAQLHLDVLACDGARACVVFMPGTNAYALLYGEFLVALAEQGVHVVGFDPRGHGRSSGARGSYTLEELLSDMDAVVHFARERFGVPVFVAGSSQGGITALYYAASGATVAGAICHNIADLSQPESARLMRSPRLGRLLRPHMGRLARLFPELPVPMSAYLDLRAEPVRGAGTAHRVLLSDPLTVPFVRLRTLASLSSGPFPDPTARVRCPVLVLQAGDDGIFPTDYVRGVFEGLRCPKTMKVYPGRAHYMVVDDVPAFLGDVTAWMDGVLAGASEASA
jgi:alpha-beta hydrolase superfamily lysophospholipase